MKALTRRVYWNVLKKKLYAKYRSEREEMKALLNAKKNVEMILGREKSEQEKQEHDSRKRP